MGSSVRQVTRVSRNSNTRIKNTYPRKTGKIVNLPRNSRINFEKGFDRADLKKRIAELKSSPAYKSGRTKAKTQLSNAKSFRARKGQALNLKNGNLNVQVSTS